MCLPLQPMLGDRSECSKVLGKLQLEQIHERPVSCTHLLLNMALERVGAFSALSLAKR